MLCLAWDAEHKVSHVTPLHSCDIANRPDVVRHLTSPLWTTSPRVRFPNCRGVFFVVARWDAEGAIVPRRERPAISLPDLAPATAAS
jgi:hypothetical protein